MCDGTDRLDWEDLLLFVEHPAIGSNVDMMGKDPVWTLQNELLAGVFDGLRNISWQLSGKGPRPEPIDRPSVRAIAEDKTMETPGGNTGPVVDIADADSSGRFDVEPAPANEIAHMLGWD